MQALTARKIQRSLRREVCVWQKAALGLFALSLAWNTAQTAWISRLEDARRETAARLEQAEQARGTAVEQLEKMVRQAEQERRARADQAAAYEAAGAYTYIGECTVTAYCPCEACCGQWADGQTATGIPAGPGIVAVDPDVIPLGSTVIIDGQRYLAADTGVTGLSVDICVADHAGAAAFGVQHAAVWVETEGGQHG